MAKKARKDAARAAVALAAHERTVERASRRKAEIDPARPRGENRGAAAAAERLDVAGAGPRGADGAAEGCLDVAGAPGDGPGRPRRADGGAEASGWALRRESNF